MPRQVNLTAQAEADILVIRGWQSQPGSGDAAKRRVLAILANIQRLSDDPCLYARGQHAGTREFSVAGHRVIYRVTPDTGRSATSGDVLVLRVFGPGQSRTTL